MTLQESVPEIEDDIDDANDHSADADVRQQGYRLNNLPPMTKVLVYRDTDGNLRTAVIVVPCTFLVVGMTAHPNTRDPNKLQVDITMRTGLDRMDKLDASAIGSVKVLLGADGLKFTEHLERSFFHPEPFVGSVEFFGTVVIEDVVSCACPQTHTAFIFVKFRSKNAARPVEVAM